MIVSPDFPDHWKTRLVVTRSGSEGAVRCILRLWGYCQQRRRWIIPELTPEMLASICGWNDDVDPLWAAMLETYIDETENGFVVHDWAETNGTLISNWTNGQKGGRPRKDGGSGEGGQQGSPADKHHGNKPMGLPMGKPAPNPLETDKRREDRRREESSLREDGEGKPSLPSDDGGSGEGGQQGSPADKHHGKSEGGEGGGDGASPVDTRTPLQEIVHLYHTHCPTLPKVLKVEGQRRKAVRARWKAAGDPPLPWFQNLFRLAGESNRIRDGSWCSFDWLMSPSNSQKVLEGNYANSRNQPTKKRSFDKP